MNLLGQRPAFDAPNLLMLETFTKFPSSDSMFSPNNTDEETLRLFRNGYLSNREFRNRLGRQNRS